MKKTLFTLIFSLLYVLVLNQSHAQARPSGKLNFSEVWVWEYVNAENETKSFAIYREPKLGYWLLTKEDAFPNSDEMTLWFIIMPEGEVLQAFKDAEMDAKPQMINYTIKNSTPKALPSRWVNTGKTQEFGDASFGFDKIKGQEYTYNSADKSSQASYYVAKSTQKWDWLTYFNLQDFDAKLPINFPTDLPAFYLPLSGELKEADTNTSFKFQSISNTEYYIHFKDYYKK